MLLLAALVAGGTLADAQLPRPDDRPHLLVVPHTPAGQAALGRSDARVVARYEEFTVVEATGADDERLRGAGADRRDDMREVSLPASELDPRRDRASLAAKHAPGRDEALAVVQFVGPVKDAWFERLRETGAQVVQYASQNAYVVHARDAGVQRLAGLVGTDTAVRAVAPIVAGDKVADGLVRGGERTMAVQTIAGEAGASARRDVAASGPELRAASSVGALRTQFVRIDGAEARALAADAGVVSITPWSSPRLLDERAARIVAGDLGTGPFDYLTWLGGKGFPAATLPFAIDVTDQGLDNGNVTSPGHSDFRANGLQSAPSRVAYATNYTGEASAADCGGHGTNVASIAAGHGVTGAARQDSAGFRYGLGIAPRAELGASKIFTCNGDFDYTGTFTNLTRAAWAAGARISNNSWGLGNLGLYSPDSQEYDSLVRDARPDQAGHQPMVEVFAAGNDGNSDHALPGEGYGTVQDPATAKNVITVGASESTRSIGGADRCGITDAEANNPKDMLDFSSRGPTDDLRMKPDLVAPGTHVVGASPQHAGYQGVFACNAGSLAGNPFYSLLSGTSQAAPEVSGAAALIRDWYTRQVGAAPSPAMTKAILLGSATDIAGGDNGKGAAIDRAPNTDQGWGRVNVGAAIDSPGRLFYDQLSMLTTTGERFLEAYDVANPTRPLKITLAWTDAPGMVGPQADAYVNDLDLVVEAGGRTYNGNVMAGGVSRPGGAADPRNNVENVVLPAGTDGNFAVKVVATNLAGDGVPGVGDATDQDFALVVSNATEDDSPVLVHEATSIDDSTPPGGDNDGVLEPNEAFGLREEVRNAGDAAATGVSGSLSIPGAAVTTSTSAWPNIGVGATATNSTMFSGQLPQQGVPCGADVAATLNLTTAEGQGAVPLTLGTGEIQPPAGASRTHSPGLPIPDDSPVGVTSTVQVANPGRIKDLNVSINGITHPFIGDLRIDVIGPDGTTVTLAEHPGGPDNNGRNFVGTVFSDQAATNISAGSAPYTGTYRPQNDQLSRFNGKQRQGAWTLRVRDLVQGATGTLGSWGTQTRIAGCDFGGSDPPTTIGTRPPDPSPTRDAIFTFSSPNTPGARFECRLGSADYEECSSPRTYSGLPDGSYSFAVRAIDASGNVDTLPPTYTWTVDAPPETTIVSGPSGVASSRQATFSFKADETASFTCQTDGQPVVTCQSPVTLQGLSDGQHTFRVWAKDSTKQDPTPAVRTWTVDTTPPETSIDSAPGGLVNRRDAVIGFRSNEPGAHFECSLDNGPMTACSSPATFAGLGDGSHTVRVRAIDAAGNTDPAPATTSWGVDATPPALSISFPRSGQALTDSTPQVTGTAGTASGDAGTVFLRLYSGRLASGLPARTLVVPRAGTTGVWSATPSSLTDGTWTVRAEQTDAAGNTGTSAPVSFDVDTTPPSFAIAPIEGHLADATRRGISVLAGCASDCRISAKLSVGGAKARALGLPTKRGGSTPASFLLGSASKRLGRGGAVTLALRPSGAARRALRKLGSLKARLAVGVAAAGAPVKLAQTVLLTRSAGMRRIARRGLRFRGACSEPCAVGASLKLAPVEARRLRLKASRGPLTVARGRAGESRTPRLVLAVGRRYRPALQRARRSATATFEAAIRGRTGPPLALKGRLRLHP